MKKNMGSVDRVLRIVIGLALAYWGYTTGNALGYLAIILIGTASVGVCPLYLPIGMNTGAKKPE